MTPATSEPKALFDFSKTYNYYNPQIESIEHKTLGIVGRVMRWTGMWHTETRRTNYVNQIHAAAIDGKLKAQAQKVFSAIHSYQEDARYGSMEYTTGQMVTYNFKGNEGALELDSLSYTLGQGNSLSIFRTTDDHLAFNWPKKENGALDVNRFSDFNALTKALGQKLKIGKIFIYLYNPKKYSPLNRPYRDGLKNLRQTDEERILFDSQALIRNSLSDTYSSRWGKTVHENGWDRHPYNFKRNGRFSNSLFFTNMAQKDPTDV